MNRTALLLFIVTFSHVPYVVSSEEEQANCWSRCLSRVSQWRCCAWIRSFCSNNEPEQAPQVRTSENEPDDITRVQRGKSEYKWVDPEDDDNAMAHDIGFIESSPTYSPRTSKTGTLRIRRKPTPPQAPENDVDGTSRDHPEKDPVKQSENED